MPARALGWGLLALAALTSQTAEAWAAQTPVSGGRSAVADAVLAAEANDVLTVLGGTYSGNFTIDKSLRIEAADGEKVVIEGFGGGPAIRVTGATTAVTLTGLILDGGDTGVSVEGGTVNLWNLAITSSTTAIRCTAGLTEILQTTIHAVTDGISCPSTLVKAIKNTILSAVSGTGIDVGVAPPVTLVSYTLFFQTSNRGTEGTSAIIEQGDPLFVAATNRDFHLKSGSPAQDRGDPTVTDSFDGSTSDLGAYGGLDAPTVPFRPGGVIVTCTAGSIACTVSWTANADYGVSGYRVSFAAPLIPSDDVYTGTATEGTSPISYDLAACSLGTCTVALSGLDPAVTAPAAPTGLTARSGDGRLDLTWDAVSGATSYQVYRGIVSGGPYDVLAADNVKATQSRIDGLINGVTYYVVVKAVVTPTLSAVVRTLYGTPVATATKASPPSDQVRGEYGAPAASAFSGEVAATPQLVVGFPRLEDTGGCFIATAAYGSAMAPQVDVLRTWRDRYLAPHAAGREFIAAYPAWSPPAADAIRRSETLRAAARVVLWPVVGVARLWLRWPWVPGIVALAAAAGVFVLARRRWRRVGA